MAKSGKIVVPSEMKGKGLPPGMPSGKSSKSRGIVVPSEMGSMGKPNSNPPGARGVDPRIGDDA